MTEKDQDKEVSSSVSGFAQKPDFDNFGNKDLTENIDESSDGGSALMNNAYAAAHSAREDVDLDKDAPDLRTSISRGVNKKAVMFVAILGVLCIVVLCWGFSVLHGSKEKAPKPKTKEKTYVPPVDPNDFKPLNNAAEVGKVDPNAQPIPVLENKKPKAKPKPEKAPAPPAPPPVDPRLTIRMGGNSNFVEDANKNEEANKAVAGGNISKGSVFTIQNPDKLLVRGTYLRCILETRIVTDNPGYASCVITEPVYSINGHTLLIPKGSKASGQYGQLGNPGSGRVVVWWDRITTPNGLDVRLKSPGVDGLGASGHIGDLRTHWTSRFSSAMLISMLGDTIQYAANKYGPAGATVSTSTSTTVNPFESQTANMLQQAATESLTKEASRQPTITINQGSLIQIYTARDIDFSDVLKD